MSNRSQFIAKPPRQNFFANIRQYPTLIGLTAAGRYPAAVLLALIFSLLLSTGGWANGNAAAPTLPEKVYLPMVSNGASPTAVYFSTLPPGSALPSGAQCAAKVKRRPENKAVNAVYNATPGNQGLASDFLSGDDPRANSDFVPRVDGAYTGTTDEIIQWAACKWGIDEDMVRAQAVIESWWRQGTRGDWGSDPSRCPPGHGLGVDGTPGLCPESWGIIQNRYPYEMSAWPAAATSTAFNLDTGYAIWRTCYEGYTVWLNTVERGKNYAAGDAWGCMGAWYSGRWYTSAALYYMGRVQDTYNARVWEDPNFQEP